MSNERARRITESHPGLSRTGVAERGNKMGRPPILLQGWDALSGTWEAETPAWRIISAIRAGNYLVAAAGYAGVNRVTVHLWHRQARTALAEAGVDMSDGSMTWAEARDMVPDNRRAHVDFLGAMRRAEATAEVELVTIWRSKASDDWRAAQQLLAQRHPDRWGNGQGSGPDAADEASGGVFDAGQVLAALAQAARPPGEQPVLNAAAEPIPMGAGDSVPVTSVEKRVLQGAATSAGPARDADGGLSVTSALSDAAQG